MSKNKKRTKPQTQLELLMEFFKKHPKQDIPHPRVVDWATKEWKKRTSSVFRDPDRGVRKLYQEGYLIKVAKGIYRLAPSKRKGMVDKGFSSKQKESIFKRDGYQCVICDLGKREGLELHADHIKLRDLGGRSTINNGQTLCSRHNMMKTNMKQTETGKKMFIRLYKLAKDQKDKELLAFCSDILRTYEKHDINGHIKWRK